MPSWTASALRCRASSIWASFVFGAGEADFESFDLAEPPFAVGFGDAVVQVDPDLFEPAALGWVWPQE
jgi:hypothetical protein